jgi:hypothetical protein
MHYIYLITEFVNYIVMSKSEFVNYIVMSKSWLHYIYEKNIWFQMSSILFWLFTFFTVKQISRTLHRCMHKIRFNTKLYIVQRIDTRRPLAVLTAKKSSPHPRCSIFHQHADRPPFRAVGAPSIGSQPHPPRQRRATSCWRTHSSQPPQAFDLTPMTNNQTVRGILRCDPRGTRIKESMDP